MKRLINALLGLVVVIALAPEASAGQGPNPTAAAEVEYLLHFAGQSGCDFYRNGGWYDSGAAKAHLRYKYEALAARGQIRSAEDFIEKAATRSSMSGRAYKVRCAGGPELSSNQWLLDALAMYRSKGGSTRPSS
jgi:hypothetical protein